MPQDLRREIEDLLDKLDEFIPEEKAPSRLRRRSGEMLHSLRTGIAGIVSRIGLGHLMVLSLILIFVAFLMRSSAFSSYAMAAGLVILALTLLISFFGSKRPQQEKRWRGQVVDLSQPSLGSRLKGWLRRGRGGR